MRVQFVEQIEAENHQGGLLGGAGSFGTHSSGDADTEKDTSLGSGASDGNRCCDGGRASEVPSNADNRLTGAAPQPRPAVKFPRSVCGECGGADIRYTAWVSVNSDEIIAGDGPLTQIWCPDCEAECFTIEEWGTGVDLWREAEASGHFLTFAEALEEAKQSDRPFEILDTQTSTVLR